MASIGRKGRKKPEPIDSGPWSQYVGLAVGIVVSGLALMLTDLATALTVFAATLWYLKRPH